MMHLEVHNEALAGKRCFRSETSWGVILFVHVFCRTVMSVFLIVILFSILGDQLFVVCAEDDAEAIIAFIGPKIEVDWEKCRILRWYPAVF